MNPYEILAQFTDIDAKYLELGDEAQIVRPCEAVEAMEAYHRAKVEAMTDEEIEKEADEATRNTRAVISSQGYWLRMGLIDGAKNLRNKLLNQ